MKAKLISLLLIILTTVAACAALSAPAASTPMGAAETVRGLQAVVRESTGTFVMQNGQQFLMAWPKGSQYAVAILGQGSAESIRAIPQDPVKLTTMVKSLQASGWSFSDPGHLPTAIVTALMGSSSVDAVLAGLRFMPSVLMVPAIVLTPHIPQSEVLQ